MCSDFEELLRELNGEVFVEIFNDHSIDEEALKYLSKNHLDIIIPKELFGQRVLFENSLIEWQLRLSKGEGNQDDVLDVDVSKKSEDVPFYLMDDCIVETILKKSLSGRNVLKFYEKNNYLEYNFRKQLSNCIVEHLLENNIITSPRLFERLAQSIAKFFPTETKDIYFVYKKGRKPGGSLYSKYHNAKLRKCGLMPFLDTCRKSPPVEKNDENRNSGENYPSDEDAKIHQDWLKFNIEPYEDVLERWKKSFHIRQKCIQEKNSLHNIFDEWPVLKQSFGYKLISEDFAKLHPTKENLLFEKWESTILSIKKLYAKHLKGEENLKLVEDLNNPSTESENRITITLYLLPYLLKPSNRKTLLIENSRKRKYIKTTIEDSRDTFLLWALNASELQSKIKFKIDEFFKNKQTLQPIICGIGPSKTHFVEIFVYYGNIFYKLPSLVLALDVCFKIFCVLDLKYPEYCQNIWLFLQEHIYEIKLGDIDKTPNLVAILNDIKQC
ncbi:uncharacterized protein LOC142237695 [Haematobia irritans]|uniref:uncharacterized protein LOC142237695 n=1 Tax=Haematobia irritans TaxID=7368 RepID=UPI003F4F5B2C